ncbi:DUF3576 domain-containing protein [Falsiroseomonas oryzae]|uniref:DUF3576 domain-containing protein n=1 Tax=Falsiroseomonas oryzae TaxID=2766473 RepID=UPI0022EAEBD0|nr:DUF3576 domain-containing protein [Roseomonas sp. MO-31]
MPRLTTRLSLGLVALVLAGCSSLQDNMRVPGLDEYSDDRRAAQVRGRVTGQDGLILLGTDRSSQRGGGGDQSGTGLGVNAFLWRATLDTLSFMPLASADPFGGVIITDWYSPPGAGSERFRVTAYILGRQLRSDGVRVVVFRQEARGNGWSDVPVSASTASELEDRVLARARELRSQSTSASR